MVFSLVSYLQHRRDCQFKRAQRVERLSALGPTYHASLTSTDRAILDKPIDELVSDVKKGMTAPLDVLHTYGRVAFRAHKRTNCLTEILLPSAEKWLTDGSINLRGPLAGIPVSLKDTIVVGGYDTTVGYSGFVGNATPEDGAMVRMLKDAGAVPYVKTNLPITLLSFESGNDVWGRTTNPHSSAYTAGGSSGGESALLAMGGRIGVGSDVAGSVRLPAHWSGCYSLRCSTGRWPKLGIETSMPGQEGVPSVYSPMARTLSDLTYFMRSVVSMKPWEYDPVAHPMPWKDDVEKKFSGTKKLRIGVLRTDGVIDPSPACARALSTVEDALRRAGHEVVDANPPDMYEALQLASLLLNADGCEMFSSFMRSGEWLDRGADQMRFLFRLPRPVKWIYYLWVRYVRQDPVWAGLIKDWHPKTAYENWHLVKRREAYRAKWFEWWSADAASFDALITPPNATPALPHEGMYDAVSSCGYTFLFNLLDYSSGVLPVTHVDRNLDQLPADFKLKKLNGVAQGAYKWYDATKMHGLPVGVQVVCRRLQEEKTLAIMGRVEEALGHEKYQLMDVD